MTSRFVPLFLVVLWSLLARFFLWPLALLAGFVSDRARHQMSQRGQTRDISMRLARLRQKYDDCIVFYCSSAGEYEQAKPLIDRISVNSRVLCHVFFFSMSGADFIKSRGDDVSWSLSPVDDAREWGSLFAALRPSKTFIVRHEIWPSFLWTASQWSQIIVINAVIPSMFGRQAKWKETLNLAIKTWLLRFVDRICVVSRSDQDFFERWLRTPSDKISVTGDTKYL